MGLSLKCQSQEKMSAYVICWNALEALWGKSVNPDQDQFDLGPHCLPIYL